MDWVILAGTVGHEVPWTRGLPRPLLPLPGTTLLEALLDMFRHSSEGSCTICANGHTDLYTKHVQSGRTLTHSIGFFEDSVPRGPAGCLKACASRLTGRSILVAGGAVWLEDDPDWMLEQHAAQGNVLTVFCSREKPETRSRSGTLWKPAGIYCCEPAVLEFIQDEGYQDLKEQLIPALQRSGLRVGAVPLTLTTCEVSDWPTYLRVLCRVLTTSRFESAGYHQVAPDIWVGDDVEIAPRARIVGPVLLGHRCLIEDEAVVVGPAIVGNGVQVGRGCWVIRSVLPDHWRCPAGAPIVDQFLPGGDRTAALKREPGTGTEAFGALAPAAANDRTAAFT